VKIGQGLGREWRERESEERERGIERRKREEEVSDSVVKK
jgi:hypothetical protein